MDDNVFELRSPEAATITTMAEQATGYALGGRGCNTTTNGRSTHGIAVVSDPRCIATNATVNVGDEVFVSYGDAKSTFHFLATYGFLPTARSGDFVVLRGPKATTAIAFADPDGWIPPASIALFEEAYNRSKTAGSMAELHSSLNVGAEGRGRQSWRATLHWIVDAVELALRTLNAAIRDHNAANSSHDQQLRFLPPSSIERLVIRQTHDRCEKHLQNIVAMLRTWLAHGPTFAAASSTREQHLTPYLAHTIATTVAAASAASKGHGVRVPLPDVVDEGLYEVVLPS
jgi:hypothetical protein